MTNVVMIVIMILGESVSNNFCRSKTAKIEPDTALLIG